MAVRYSVASNYGTRQHGGRACRKRILKLPWHRRPGGGDTGETPVPQDPLLWHRRPGGDRADQMSSGNQGVIPPGGVPGEASVEAWIVGWAPRVCGRVAVLLIFW